MGFIKGYSIDQTAAGLQQGLRNCSLPPCHDGSITTMMMMTTILISGEKLAPVFNWYVTHKQRQSKMYFDHFIS